MEKIDWFTPLMTIIGVIIGALLTPFVTSIMEKNKIKLALKPELIRSIYLFFNLRKAIIETENFSMLSQTGVKFVHNALVKTIDSPPARNELERQHTVLNNKLDYSITLNNSYFRELVDLEAKIHSLLFQINTYYGNDEYIVLKDLIDPPLKASNSNNHLHDYGKLTESEYNQLVGRLQNEISEKSLLLQDECDKLIVKISSKF